MAALEQWPLEGIPARPGAWLMSTAKHRGIDQFRRRSVLQRKHDEIGRELEFDSMRPSRSWRTRRTTWATISCG